MDENLDWIKLHRRLLQSVIFTSEKGLKVWIWCLLRANHQEEIVYLGLHKVTVYPGQFIFGRDSASVELEMSPSTVRNWMEVLKKDSYIDISPTNKYSIVTIKKWSEYQHNDTKMDNKITTKKQQNNTDKNVKNEKKGEGEPAQKNLSIPVLLQGGQSSKKGLFPCTPMELWEIAGDLNVPLAYVHKKHKSIMSLIEFGEFQLKYPKNKTVYSTLRSWIDMDITRGIVKEMDWMEREIWKDYKPGYLEQRQKEIRLAIKKLEENESTRSHT